jgi:hypothetical protein
MFKQDIAVLVEHSRCLAAGVDDFKELIEESRCLECELPVGFVDIEHASLHSRICRGFRFVDRRSNAVDVEDPGKSKATEPRTDDRN